MATNDTHKLNNPKAKLSDLLWNNTLKIRQMARDTDFVQGIKTGTLDPEKFGAFCVQDSIYLYKQQLNIQAAALKAKDYPDQLAYLTKRIETYKTHYETAFKTWHIGKPDGIVLGTALTKYTEYEKNVALTKESIYFLVAMCPCLKLWPWLGQQIDDGNHGIYKAWASANFNKNYTGYEKVDKIIDDAQTKGIIDEDLAMEIYTQCMDGEYNFFKSM